MVTEQAAVEAARVAGLEPVALVIEPLDDSPAAVRLVEDSTLYPGSMIKTPLAMVAYGEIEAGNLDLDQRFEVTQANMTSNDATSPLVPGYRATVRELIELMITISDNVATNMFFDILGREHATAVARERFGLTRTSFDRKLSGSEPLIHDPDWTSGVRNTHPPVDAVRAFALIDAGNVPYSDALRATLGRQHFNDRLSRGLRTDDRFFHKTGGTDEVSHDGGILETAEGRRYAIAVYTGLPSTDAGDLKFGPFMQRIREDL